MSNEGYHEPIHELTGKTREMHRAITSLLEELEAIDWYLKKYLFTSKAIAHKHK